MKYILVLTVAVAAMMFIMTTENIKQREQIISLQTDNKLIWNQIMKFSKDNELLAETFYEVVDLSPRQMKAILKRYRDDKK